MSAKSKQSTKQATKKRPSLRPSNSSKRSSKPTPGGVFLRDAKEHGFVLKTQGSGKVYVIAKNQVRAFSTHSAPASSARALLAKLGIKGSEYSALRRKVVAGVQATIVKAPKR